MENNQPLPFYQTRKFWVIIVSSIILVNLVLLAPNITEIQGLENIVITFISILGGVLFTALGFQIAGQFGVYVGALLFLVIVVTIAKKAFRPGKISLIYPILLSIIIATGLVFNILIGNSL